MVQMYKAVYDIWIQVMILCQLTYKVYSQEYYNKQLLILTFKNSVEFFWVLFSVESLPWF